MDWATKRKLLFIAGFFGIIFLIIGLVYLLRYYQAPTCTDLKQNQGEQGVDCGGPCTIVCSSQISDPVVFWQRSFESTHGMYNAVAYVENPNSDLGVEEAVYRFKLYDAQNIYITERIGKTFIAPNERFAIFEPRLPVGERLPKRTVFEFVKFSSWKKVEGEKPTLFVRGEQITGETEKPKATATLENKLLIPINNIDVSAIIYDTDDNAIAASATLVDSILPESSFDVVFTWQQPFRAPPVRIEVIPRINPFVTITPL
jgi:hypothetical protein